MVNNIYIQTCNGIYIQTCNGAHVAFFSHNTPFLIDKMQTRFKNSLATGQKSCIQIKKSGWQPASCAAMRHSFPDDNRQAAQQRCDIPFPDGNQ